MADLERFKLSNIVYDSDKNLEGLFAQVDTCGSMVRSYRSSVHQSSVPSFLLQDPDFAGPAPMIEAINPNDPEGDDTGALVSELAVAESNNASANATFASAAVGSDTTIRSSYISRWSDSDFNNCVSDWGKSNDEIDWDAITNGDINGDVD